MSAAPIGQPLTWRGTHENFVIAFRKVHGAGNDFILVADPCHVRDWGKLATGLCHRRMGVGADGLVVSERISASAYAVTCYNPMALWPVCAVMRCAAQPGARRMITAKHA